LTPYVPEGITGYDDDDDDVCKPTRMEQNLMQKTLLLGQYVMAVTS